MKKIYYNGDFITLEEPCEAILIKDKIIQKIGTKEKILSYKDAETELIDLNGKTIMPSFIDTHSHFMAVANNFLQVSLKNCIDFKEIGNRLKEFQENNKYKKDEWIIASGYDDSKLIEKRNITKEELDKIVKNNPVVLKHSSEHSGIFNTVALEKLGITEKTVVPEGGKIEVKNGRLTGLLEENAFIKYIKLVPMPSNRNLLNACLKAQKKYLSYGITTLQEGMLTEELVPIYLSLLESKNIEVDLVAYIDIKKKEEIKEKFIKNIGKYYKNIKIGGYKIFLDGSPQLRTAWLRKPYEMEKEYCGYNTMDTKEVEQAMVESQEDNMQLLAHCNGDRAIQQYIEAIGKQNQNFKDLRPVIIHAQLLGMDQLEKIKMYSIILSFFIGHVYYWGDIHIKNLGKQRAELISPAKSALKEKIIFTFHQDSPVIEPNMFETIWCAVKRKTQNGKILGKDERIPLIDAIKAVTINAAYQYFEENQKGSIKEGKLANLIIIDKNPFKIQTDKIKDIQILETIKEGKTLWKK